MATMIDKEKQHIQKQAQIKERRTCVLICSSNSVSIDVRFHGNIKLTRLLSYLRCKKTTKVQD